MKLKQWIIICLLSLWGSVYAEPISWLAVCGDTYTVVATPAEGYHFTQWSNGSTDSTLFIEATEGGETEFTAFFAPNGGEATGVDGVMASKLTLYPTFVSRGGQITLDGLRPEEETSIFVFSTTGQLIHAYRTIGEETYLLEAGTTSGCFYVQVHSPRVKAVLRYVVKPAY